MALLQLLDLPYDVLLTIGEHLPISSLLNLRSICRFANDIFSPRALQGVHLSFTYPNAYYSLTTDTQLHGIHEHTRHVSITINDQYVSDYLSVDLVPGLWGNLSRLHSLDSLELNWELHDNENGMKVLHTWLERISSCLVRPQGRTIKSLIVRPPSRHNPLPKALLMVSGLECLTIGRNPLMYAIRNCEEVDEEIAYFRNGQSCCVAESTTVDMYALIRKCSGTLRHLSLDLGCRTWRVKPDALVPYLRTLQGLEFPGFASGPDIDLDRLNLDNLRSLRHLNVFHPSSDSSSGISLWDALKGAGVALISLCCNEVTDALIDYLMSFSGLQELDIRRIKATSNKMNHAFFNQVLPKHAPTLTKLYLRVHPIDGAIEGWCYDPGSWVLVFPLFLRLGYLHIHPPPLSPRDRALNRIASMKANYQAILNGVQGIRTLQQLEIFVPSIPRTVVRGLPRASKQLETSVREVVQSLVVPGDRPKELVAANRVYLLGKDSHYHGPL